MANFSSQYQPGDFLGRYQLAELIGHGGFGEVWRARDPQLGRRQVAIKIMLGGAQDPQGLARFERELELTAQMRHPNIVTVFDTGIGNGLPFMVMELLDGHTLADVRPAGSWNPAEVAWIGSEVCAALGHAHGQDPPVVHRDIKPSNIFVCGDRRVKVTDFGIATTATGTVPGTAYGIVLSPQGGTAYVIDQTTCHGCTGTVGISSLVPVNLGTGAAGHATTIAEGATGSGNEAFQVALSPDGKTAYVMSGSGVVPVDLATRGKRAVIKIGNALSQIAISPGGGTLYVTTGGNKDLVAVSLRTGDVLGEISTGSPILAIAPAPEGGSAYLYDTGGIASVNPATRHVNWRVTSPDLGSGGPTPASLAVMPGGLTAYAAGGGTGVVPVDLATHHVGQLNDLNDAVCAVVASPDGKTVYAAGLSGAVYPINAATNQVGKAVSTGSSANAQSMAIAP